MLIIFDLDDTLIPTSSLITPYKFQRVLSRFPYLFKDTGQVLRDFERILSATSSSKDAIKELLFLYQIDCATAASMIDLFSDHELPESLCWSDAALSVLDQLAPLHQLAVVTRGQTGYQKKKMALLEEFEQFFQQVVIVEKGSKLGAYQELMASFEASGFHTMVIGDRIDWDLCPAKQLNCHTVWLNRALRSLSAERLKGCVDYQICSLSALSAIIDAVELRNFLRKI